MTLGLAMVILLAGPWVAWRAGSMAYGADVRANAWEKQHHRPAVAVLVQDAPNLVYAAGEAPPLPTDVSVLARWSGPDGVDRSGAVPVPAGMPAGSTVPVWIDEHGDLVRPPRRRNAGVDASAAALLAVAVLVALLAGVRRIVVRRLDRRRLRSWEAEWMMVGPRWSRR
nr:hypothetical protein [Pseudosporangium ferrugineum]